MGILIGSAISLISFLLGLWLGRQMASMNFVRVWNAHMENEERKKQFIREYGYRSKIEVDDASEWCPSQLSENHSCTCGECHDEEEEYLMYIVPNKEDDSKPN